MDSKRLRIAMQKSGRLSQDSQALLKSCGLKINLREDRLIAHVENMPIDILRVRDDDIPGLVMDGVVDLGIVGENVLEETMLEREALGLPVEYKELKRLDYGGCRLSLAIPQEQNRITSYNVCYTKLLRMGARLAISGVSASWDCCSRV